MVNGYILLDDAGDVMQNANYVTNPAFDPVSKQPELKFCAVRIEAASQYEDSASIVQVS